MMYGCIFYVSIVISLTIVFCKLFDFKIKYDDNYWRNKYDSLADKYDLLKHDYDQLYTVFCNLDKTINRYINNIDSNNNNSNA